MGPPPYPTKVKKIISFVTSRDSCVNYTAEELIKAPPAELKLLIPDPIRRRISTTKLKILTPDELSHLIPTSIWLNSNKKRNSQRCYELSNTTLDPLTETSPDKGTSGSTADKGKEKPPIPVKKNVERPLKLQEQIAAATEEITVRNDAERTRWIVVYTPHPDDETYGVGGLIAHCATRGIRVLIVLFTLGEASAYYYPWSLIWKSQALDASRESFGNCRLDELTEATAKLGQHVHVEVHNIPDGQLDWEYVMHAAEAAEHNIRPIRHFAVEGISDSWHPDHIAVATGIRRAEIPMHKKRWYYVYRDFSEVLCPWIQTRNVTPFERQQKNSALLEYRLTDPAKFRYGIAFHSTAHIWLREYNDTRELLSTHPRKLR